MKAEQVLESLRAELKRITGLGSVIEPIAPDNPDTHLRVLLGAVDLDAEDEGLDAEDTMAFRTVVTLQAKGPGSQYWLGRVITGCLLLATAFRSGRRRAVFTLGTESIPVTLVGRRTSTPDRQMFKNEESGALPFEYYETWSVDVLMSQSQLTME